VTTVTTVTTYDQLIDRIIADGIAEVRDVYAAPKEHHKRDGAIEGFEACRGKTPPELFALWTAAEKECAQLRTVDTRELDVKAYWKCRYKVLQIEFVCNVVAAGLLANGQLYYLDNVVALMRPLCGRLLTARGVLKYAEIVGNDAIGELSAR
jgi:hypothetical protein